ncbi:hypothetical protein ACS8FD_07175 [Psychrobacter sp. 1U2]|uniref:hypothetical protein n=1 Tax=Psychrobacter sp. 1U2 TaxID=3453577 RepID=UPI003F4757DA
MQRDIFRDFFLSQDLIDVGSTGIASQSSYSKWSNENDAQQAISGKEFKDFAFHTDVENNPWWQIHFETSTYIKHVIINNRKKKPFDEIASTLRVLAYDNLDNEVLLHTGTLFFGNEDKGCPLILSLKDGFLLKKLKIELLGNSYLHLSNIRFLAKDPLSSIDKKLFLANRTDGMGERLRAILNAMVLAKRKNNEFLFSWEDMDNDFHAISNQNFIFNNDFKKKHIVSIEKITEMSPLPLPKVLSVQQSEDKTDTKFLVQHGKISEILPFPYYNFPSIDYNNAFNSIGFSDEMLSAKFNAIKTPLPDKVIGIHIRAGDIVFGRSRMEPIFYTKVLPFFLLENIIINLTKEGFAIIVFGQDDSLCNYLAEKYSVVYSKNLIEESYNDSQVALFDITLMARCQRVIAGHSGFAILSGLIGGVEISNGYDSFPDINSKLKAFKDFYYSNDNFMCAHKIHPFLKSFSIIQFVEKYQNHIPIKDKISYLNHCIKLDYENIYYKLFLSSLYIKDDKVAKADLYLESQLKENRLQEIVDISKIINWKHTTPLTPFISDFKNAADEGSIVSALILLINDISLKNNIDVNYYETIARKSQNSISTILIYEKLESIS